MTKENNQIHKIAIIDSDKEIFSILEEQKEVFIDYSWVHFKSLRELIEEKTKIDFDLFLINETIICNSFFNITRQRTLKNFSLIIFILSLNNRNRDRISKNFFKSKIINKPFKLNSLINIISDILISQNKKMFIDISIGSFVLKPNEKTLFSESDKKNIFLTEIEVKILTILIRYDGMYVKKDEVLRQVWGIRDPATTHTLETHIYRLRKKILAKFGNNFSIVSKIGKYSLKY